MAYMGAGKALLKHFEKNKDRYIRDHSGGCIVLAYSTEIKEFFFKSKKEADDYVMKNYKDDKGRWRLGPTVIVKEFQEN